MVLKVDRKIADIMKNASCLVCQPGSMKNMKPNEQDHRETTDPFCPVLQLIRQVPGLGDSFVVYC
jgi:hypothetical protein